MRNRFISHMFARFVLTVAMISSAYAQTFVTWDFLNKTVYSELSEADWAELRSTARDLLDNHEDGFGRSWTNDATGAEGEIKVLKTVQQDGRTCRWTMFKTTKQDLSGQGKFLLCQIEDGSWKVASMRN